MAARTRGRATFAQTNNELAFKVIGIHWHGDGGHASPGSGFRIGKVLIKFNLTRTHHSACLFGKPTIRIVAIYQKSNAGDKFPRARQCRTNKQQRYA